MDVTSDLRIFARPSLVHKALEQPNTRTRQALYNAELGCSAEFEAPHLDISSNQLPCRIRRVVLSIGRPIRSFTNEGDITLMGATTVMHISCISMDGICPISDLPSNQQAKHLPVEIPDGAHDVVTLHKVAHGSCCPNPRISIGGQFLIPGGDLVAINLFSPCDKTIIFHLDQPVLIFSSLVALVRMNQSCPSNQITTSTQQPQQTTSSRAILCRGGQRPARHAAREAKHRRIGPLGLRAACAIGRVAHSQSRTRADGEVYASVDAYEDEPGCDCGL